jgi:hypothetical protein
MSYLCSSCHDFHEGLPYIGVDKPDLWWDVPEGERGRRVVLTSEGCIVDGEHYFIRGVVEIPILGRHDCLCFSVWISQRPEDFFAYRNNRHSEDIGPFPGQLGTRISFYADDTRLLKAATHFRGGGARPLIKLEPAAHPLVIAQREGMSLSHALSVIHDYLSD